LSAAADSTLPADLKDLRTLGGDHTWNTEDGAVVIDVKSDTILITESLEPALTEQFRHAVFATTATQQ
jgi:hypothetical protein